MTLAAAVAVSSCQTPGRDKDPAAGTGEWSVSALPSSVRLDPVSNEIIEQRFRGVENGPRERDLLEKNWVYDGEQVSLQAARGEYVSFQLVITSHTDSILKGIRVEMTPFAGEGQTFGPGFGSGSGPAPELFLEWAVEVKTPSTGYPRASLGTGWYPDALIPLEYIQTDSSAVHGRWTYPLWLPDFNNRIDGQRSHIIWVDQYVPFEREKALPGEYTSTARVTIGDQTQELPVTLEVWDFAIPNENKLKAGLQQEGFASGMSPAQELETYQLLKRNRIALLDPTYQPGLEVSGNGKVSIQWDDFDRRVKKYLTGEAFTAEYGYSYGPGYGEPVENFMLPFDVYGKHGTPGWPDIGRPEVERRPENRAVYVAAVRQVRSHLRSLVDTSRTDLTVYLNGLDESYFPEAWDRMVYYGDLFEEEYPEVQFRVDGAYTDEAMQVIAGSIDAWASHTINYNLDKVRKYQGMGIRDWLYGPMLYEGKVNSWVGSSTFTDLPLLNDRAISWACWKYRTYSWISWGIGAGWKNGWYDPESWKDAYKAGADTDPGYTYKILNGSALMIYSPGIVPNVPGPCPSIRLKTMRDGVQEYEYMRLLAETDGNRERADSIVNTIIKHPFGDQSIGNLDVWSFDAEQWDRARIALGELIHEARGSKR